MYLEFVLTKEKVDRMVPKETLAFTNESKAMKTRIMIHDWMHWMVKLHIVFPPFFCAMIFFFR